MFPLISPVTTPSTLPKSLFSATSCGTVANALSWKAGQYLVLQSVPSKLFLEFPELSHRDLISHQKVTQAERELVPTTSQVPERPQKGVKSSAKPNKPQVSTYFPPSDWPLDFV